MSGKPLPKETRFNRCSTRRSSPWECVSVTSKQPAVDMALAFVFNSNVPCQRTLASSAVLSTYTINETVFISISHEIAEFVSNPEPNHTVIITVSG